MFQHYLSFMRPGSCCYFVEELDLKMRESMKFLTSEKQQCSSAAFLVFARCACFEGLLAWYGRLSLSREWWEQLSLNAIIYFSVSVFASGLTAKKVRIISNLSIKRQPPLVSDAIPDFYFRFRCARILSK